MVEFNRVIGALEQAGVDYALCGGLALAVHGVARSTKDIDLLVEEASVPAALDALAPLGFRFRAFPMKFPDGMRIQRVTRIDGRELLTVDLLIVGEESRDAWATRAPYPTAGGQVVAISRDALIALKVWAGRPQDLADVQRLQEIDR